MIIYKRNELDRVELNVCGRLWGMAQKETIEKENYIKHDGIAEMQCDNQICRGAKQGSPNYVVFPLQVGLEMEYRPSSFSSDHCSSLIC